MAEPAGGAAYRMASDFAREHRVFVHAGTIMEKVENEARIWNTSFVFDRSGREVAAYRKIHMFDIVAPDGSVYRESDSVKPGGEIVTYDIEGLKVGCAICYDIASRNSSCAWRKRAATHRAAGRVHVADRQGPLGGAGQGARHRDAGLFHCLRPDRRGDGRRRAARLLRAFAGV